MTKANWKEAPHDADTYERHESGVARFCKPGFFCTVGGRWEEKEGSGEWTILEHRPRIIAWEDMKEGMVVRCLHSEGSYNYKAGKCYPVGVDEYGDLGPLDDDGQAPPSHYLGRYTFELVSEPESENPWDDFFDSPENVSDDFMDKREQDRLDPNSWDVLIESPEGEGEGWTHTYNDDNCYIKVDELDRDGYFVVVTEANGYMLLTPGEIEPIKPTITKEQFELLEKARQYFDIEPKDFAKFMNDYDVTGEEESPEVEVKPKITNEQIEGANMLASFLGTDGDTMQDFLCEYVCAEPADGPQW